MRAYLRLDDDAEDDLVAALVKAARLSVEALAGRVMIDSLWRIALDGWPESRVIPLPLSPLIAIERGARIRSGRAGGGRAGRPLSKPTR